MTLEVVSTIFWCHCSHISATAAVLLLLLLSYYCCFHITPVTSAFPGAAELTTQLLRLISILYLPLCRINKFGFYFPRNCRDPLYLWVIKTVFWRRCRGGVALLISSPGEYTLPLSLFLFCFTLFCLVYFCLVYLCLVYFCLVLFCLGYFCLVTFCLVLFSSYTRKSIKIWKNLKIKNCCYGRTHNLFGAYWNI